MQAIHSFHLETAVELGILSSLGKILIAYSHAK